MRKRLAADTKFIEPCLPSPTDKPRLAPRRLPDGAPGPVGIITRGGSGGGGLGSVTVVHEPRRRKSRCWFWNVIVLGDGLYFLRQIETQTREQPISAGHYA
jgi:hypothetical protein